MADLNQEARIPVYINDEQAKSALKNLTAEAEKWRKKMYEAMSAGDLKGMKDAEREFKKVNKAISDVKREAFDVNKILSNLSTASVKDLRKTLQLLIKDQEHLTRGTVEYAQKAKLIQAVRTELSLVNGQVVRQQSLFSRTANNFNKYFGMASAALASFAGVALTVKSSVQAFSEFDDKLADVMKTTGLTKDQVKSLNEELKKIDTRTSQNDLLDLARVAGKLGISAETDVLGFVRAADKIRVALAEDLGGDVEEAINQVGKLVDIFKLSPEFGIEQAMLKVGSAINSLGAAGTANEAYIVEFSKRLAGIAPSAGISIQQVMGLGATLDELGQTSEVAGTVVNNVISAMFKDTATYAGIAGMKLAEFIELLNTDANQAFIKVLEGAKGSGSGFSEMAINLDKLGLDGARSTGVLAVLGNNIDKLREKQALSNIEFARGSSLTNEFNTKNETAQAKIEKARKAFAEMQKELGERLAPAYAGIISKSSALIRILGIIVQFAFNHGKAIMIAASAIAGYTVATKIAAATDGVWLGVKKLLTGQISLATIAQKGFNLAVKANPIGLIVGALAAGITWLIAWNEKTGRLTDDFKKMGSHLRDLANWFINLYNESLFVRAGFEEMMAMWKTGFAIVSGVLRIVWEELKLTGKIIEGILTLDFSSIRQAYTDFYSRVKDTVVSSAQKVGNTWVTAYNNTVSGKMRTIIPVKVENGMVGPEPFTEPAQSTTSKKKTPVELTKEQIEAAEKLKKEAEEKAQKERDKAFQKAQDDLTNNYTNELNLLKQKFLDKKLIEEQYNDEQYILEIAHLELVKGLYKKYGKDTSDIEGKIMDTKLAMMKKLDDQLMKRRDLEKPDFNIFDPQKQKLETDKLEQRKKQNQEIIDDETKKQEAVKKTTEAIIENAVQSGMAAVENAENFKDASKAVLNSIREQIRAYIAEAVITAALKALKTVPFPFNMIAATVAGGAATLLFNKLIPKFDIGGFTSPGSRYQPAGIVHAGEYVIPQEGVNNPQVRPIINLIEKARQNNSLARTNLYYPSPGYASGGYVAPIQAAGFSPGKGEYPAPAGGGGQIDTQTALALTAAINRLMTWQPKVYTSLIKKDLDTLNEIDQNSGL